jgi:hypothetical protein
MAARPLARAEVLPEPALPDCGEIVARARALARVAQVARGRFLSHHDVPSEA